MEKIKIYQFRQRMKHLYFKLIVFSLFIINSLISYSQKYICDFEVRSGDIVYVKAVYNKDEDHFINVFIDGANDEAYCGTIAANSSLAINRPCRRFVKVEVQGGRLIQILNAKSEITKREKSNSANITQTEFNKIKENTTEIQDLGKIKSKKIPYVNVKTYQAEDVIKSFKLYLDTVSYYSNDYMQELNSEIDIYVKALKYMKQENRDTYIKEEQLNGYITDAKVNLEQHKEETNEFINTFITENYFNVDIIDKQICLDELHKILSQKLAEREEAIARLDKAMDVEQTTTWIETIVNDKSMLMNIGLGLLFLIILIFVIKKIRKISLRKIQTSSINDNSRQHTQTDIVVRRKTTSILKKQSLEDVHDNPAYLKIDSIDFCENSAVRRIYFKNTCIKDIYNMYSENLRNPERPNEDGCMVLGRWVHDNENDEYYVSLEEIVKPGDDAVFKEYELNFGGKIKLKVSEKLRKLRRETNLQYDMTCWVHSHPGLGVFFSNADNAVQMQLKHPTHPKFLTAIVVDILTPDQELGIFTFKHDMTINSKSDLKKMYSLENLYKWAVASDRNSFKEEDYYNIMLSSKSRINEYYGVELSNGAIIDMCQLVAEQQSGFSGWIHGFLSSKGEKREFVVQSILKEKTVADNEKLGCFLIGTHRSIPTIRKMIASVTVEIQFILFYSQIDDLITLIPIIDGIPSIDEEYYGKEKLEKLKIWTRRKR